MVKEYSREELVIKFVEEAKWNGLTDRTISGYRKNIPKFFTFLDESGLSLLYIGLKEAFEYQGWLLESKKISGDAYSKRTVNSFIVSITAFYDFLKTESLIPTNPFKSIKRVQADKTLPRDLLSIEEFDDLLNSLKMVDPKAHVKNKLRQYKVHLAVELMYSTGLRIDELSKLKPEDIDLESCVLFVKVGKGGASRRCFLNRYVRDILKIYIEEVRPTLIKDWHERKDTLFLTGRDWLAKIINTEVKCHCEKLFLHKQTCHSFRHTLGYHLHKSGCSIRFIQQILGHKRLSNTEIYVKIDDKDVHDTIDSCHPRDWSSVK